MLCICRCRFFPTSCNLVYSMPFAEPHLYNIHTSFFPLKTRQQKKNEPTKKRPVDFIHVFALWWCSCRYCYYGSLARSSFNTQFEYNKYNNRALSSSSFTTVTVPVIISQSLMVLYGYCYYTSTTTTTRSSLMSYARYDWNRKNRENAIGIQPCILFQQQSSGSVIIDIIAKNSPLLVRNRRLPSSPPFPFNSRIFYANKREISAVIPRRALQKKTLWTMEFHNHFWREEEMSNEIYIRKGWTAKSQYIFCIRRQQIQTRH